MLETIKLFKIISKETINFCIRKKKYKYKKYEPLLLFKNKK